MSKAKQFSDFTYGVGLELNATSFKQVKDTLKGQLENMTKLVKGYSAALKIDPNADLSKLFNDMNELKSVIDGIQRSNNSFGDFIDKGLVERVGALEQSLTNLEKTFQGLASYSQITTDNISTLTKAMNGITDPLKKASNAKRQNIFGDQSQSIKNTQDQIDKLKSQETEMNKLNDSILASFEKISASIRRTELDKVAKGSVTETEEEIRALVNSFNQMYQDLENGEDIVKVADKYNEAMKKLSTIAYNDPDIFKSLNIDSSIKVKIQDELQNILETFENYIKSIQKDKSKLESELKTLQDLQVKYANNVSQKASKVSPKASRAKSLGTLGSEDGGDYTIKAKIIPKVNEVEWSNKINSVIKNIEPVSVVIAPTFSRNSATTQKEIEGNLAQISHNITVDFEVNANVERFNKKIKAVDDLIKQAHKSFDKQSKFYVKFDYEEGHSFRDIVFDTIKELKHIKAKIEVSDGYVFLGQVKNFKNKAMEILKNVGFEMKLKNEEQVILQVDDLRNRIQERLGTIELGISTSNLGMAMLAAFMQMANSMFGSNSGSWSVNNQGPNPVPPTPPSTPPSGGSSSGGGKSSNTPTVSTPQTNSNNSNDISKTTEQVNTLSAKAKEAIANISRLESAINSLKTDKINSSLFLALGSYNDGIKQQGSEKQTEKLLNEYYNARNEQDALKNQFKPNDGSDAERQFYNKCSEVKMLKDSLNLVLDSQIKFLENQLNEQKAILQQEQDAASGKSSKTSNKKSEEKVTDELTKLKTRARTLKQQITRTKGQLDLLDKNGFNSKEFIELGEWNEKSQHFKHNKSAMSKLIEKYNNLTDPSKTPKDMTDEAKVARNKEINDLQTRLNQILSEQKKHLQDINSQSKKELETTNMLIAAKEANKNTSQTQEPQKYTDNGRDQYGYKKSNTTNKNQIVEIKTEAELAQSTVDSLSSALQDLQKNKFNSKEFLNLGDFNKYLQPISGSDTAIKSMLDQYNTLTQRIGPLTLEEKKSLSSLESELNNVYKNQVNYLQTKLKVNQDILDVQQKINTASSNNTIEQKEINYEAIRDERNKLQQQFNDLSKNGFHAKSFSNLGELDKSSGTFKKNSEELKSLVKTYDDLKKARQSFGLSSPSSEELRIETQLSSILEVQKKHISEILMKKEQEMLIANKVYRAYQQQAEQEAVMAAEAEKQAQREKKKEETKKTDNQKNTSSDKSTSPVKSSDVSLANQNLDELNSKLANTKKILSDLENKKGGVNAILNSGIGDVTGVLKEYSDTSIEAAVRTYTNVSNLIKESTQLGISDTEILGNGYTLKDFKVAYENISSDLKQIYDAQVNYCKTIISETELEIQKQKELLGAKKQVTEEIKKQSSTKTTKNSTQKNKQDDKKTVSQQQAQLQQKEKSVQDTKIKINTEESTKKINELNKELEDTKRILTDLENKNGGINSIIKSEIGDVRDVINGSSTKNLNTLIFSDLEGAVEQYIWAYKEIANAKKQGKTETDPIWDGKEFEDTKLGDVIKECNIVLKLLQQVRQNQIAYCKDSINSIESEIAKEKQLLNSKKEVSKENEKQLTTSTKSSSKSKTKSNKSSSKSGVKSDIESQPMSQQDINRMQQAANAAKKAQENIDKCKAAIQDLNANGFNAEKFLDIGLFNKNFKAIEGSKDKLQSWIEKYKELSNKTSAENAHLYYDSVESPQYIEDVRTLVNLEELLNDAVKNQIIYLQRQVGVNQQVLDKQKEINAEVNKREKSTNKSSSKQTISDQESKQLSEELRAIQKANGSLTTWKKALKGIANQGFNSISFGKTGEWDESKQDFKHNQQELEDMVKTYNDLKKAREKSGITQPIQEEIDLEKRLTSILESQKKHISEKIAKKAEELAIAQKVYNQHKDDIKQSNKAVKSSSNENKKSKTSTSKKTSTSSKSKTKNTNDSTTTTSNQIKTVGTDAEVASKKLDELNSKLKKAQDTLSMLSNNKTPNGVFNSKLGDINNRLKQSKLSQKNFPQLKSRYDNLVDKKSKLEQQSDFANNKEYQQTIAELNKIRSVMGKIYADQVKYCEQSIKRINKEIDAEKQLLKTKQQQNQEDDKAEKKKNQSKKTSINKTNTDSGKSTTKESQTTTTTPASSNQSYSTNNSTQQYQNPFSQMLEYILSSSQSNPFGGGSSSNNPPSVVGLDGPTLSQLAQENTLQSIGQKLDTITNGVKITPSSTPRSNNQVSTTTKNSTQTTTTPTPIKQDFSSSISKFLNSLDTNNMTNLKAELETYAQIEADKVGYTVSKVKTVLDGQGKLISATIGYIQEDGLESLEETYKMIQDKETKIRSFEKVSTKVNASLSNQNTSSFDPQSINKYQAQLDAFIEQVKRSGQYTGKFKEDIDGLQSALNGVSDNGSLNKYKDAFATINSNFAGSRSYNKWYEDLGNSVERIVKLRAQLKNAGPNEQSSLQKQIKSEQEIVRYIESQLKSNNQLYDSENKIRVIEEARAKANRDIELSSARNADNVINKNNKKINNTVSNAEEKLSNMKYKVDNSKVQLSENTTIGLSPQTIQLVNQYTSSLEVLRQKQEQLKNNPQLFNDTAYMDGFKNLVRDMDGVEKKFNQLVNSANKFEQKIKSESDIKIMGDQFNPNNLASLHTEMQAFANEVGYGSAKLVAFNDAQQTATYEVRTGQRELQTITVEYNAATNVLGRYTTQTTHALTASESFFNSLKHGFRNVTQYFLSFGSVYRIFSQIRQGFTYVKEIDTALTELKKVTDETDVTYQRFVNDMAKVGTTVGSTTKDLVNSAADWARLGYSIQDAGELAKNTAILMNVSEFDDISNATDSMISALKAFNYEAEDSLHVVDIFNTIGNNFAISTSDLASSLTKSASALTTAGVDLEQAAALLTGANTIMQDPDSVSQGLKIISLRIRGVKSELEDLGEDTEDLINTSKMQAKIKALTGVDILDEATGGFRNIYDILMEIADVWDNLDSMSQASVIELMAGKNRSNVFASIMKQSDTIKSAYETALDSDGSALVENAKYLDSIQGRIDILENSVQNFWTKTVNSELAKGIINIGTSIMNLVNKIGLIPTALAGVLTYFLAIKRIKPSAVFEDLSAQVSNYKTALGKIKAIQSLNVGTGAISEEQFNSQNIKNYAKAVSDLSVKQQAAVLSSAGLTKAQAQLTMVENGVDASVASAALAENNLTTTRVTATEATVAETLAVSSEEKAKLSKAATDWLAANGSKQLSLELVKEAVDHEIISKETAAEIIVKNSLITSNNMLNFSLKGLGTTIKALMATNPVGMIMLVISTLMTVIPIISQLHKSNEELISDAENIKNAYTQASDGIKQNITSIESVKEEFKTLSKGVNDFGENVSLSTDDYKRYQEIVEQIVGISPSLIQGFDSEGKAIANKNSLIERSIELMKLEQQQKAKDAISGNNLDTLKNGVKAQADAIKSQERQSTTDTRNEFARQFADGVEKYVKNDYNTSMQDVFASLFDDVSMYKYIPDAYTFANVYADQIIADLQSEDSKLAKYFENDPLAISSLLAYVGKYEEAISESELQIKEAFKGYNTILSTVAQSTDEYNNLDVDMQGYVDKFISNMTITDDNFDEKQQEMMNLINWIQGSQDQIREILNSGQQALLSTKSNGKSLSYNEYLKQIEDFKNELDTLVADEEQRSWIKSLLGLEDGKESELEINKQAEHAKSLLKGTAEEIDNYVGNLSVNDLKILVSVSETNGGMTIDELEEKLIELRKNSGVDVTPVFTYSKLSENIDSYNDALKQTNEIITDNTEVTQEYKDALTELGISETELNKCFYDDNKLIVKDAAALNKLVKSAKNETAANVKLAKSQAMLKYTQLQQKAHNLAQKYNQLTAAEKSELNTLYEEMGALQKNIARYSALEHSLLGAANAYEKFAEAQEIDASNTYTDQAQDMVNALAEAFNTAKLGTESAQAAIAGLIPESVYKDIDTLDDKMQAIYDYFTTGKLSDYFTIEFDDDGGISSVVMEMENVKKFVEDGIGNNVFTGDWKQFDLDPSIKSLQQLADQMGVTKEVAFATLQEMEKYDINWLGGDFSVLLDRLSPSMSDINEWENQLREEFKDVSPSIDVAVRPVIDSDSLNNLGYNVADGDWATFLSETINASDLGLDISQTGEYYINVTPILPNGDVIEADNFREYLREQVDKNGKQGLIDAGVYLGTYDTIEEAETAANRLHELSAALTQAQQSYNLESDIYKTSNAMAELDQQFINGTISSEDYSEKSKQLASDMENLGQIAEDKVLSYIQLQNDVNDVSNKLTESNKKLAEAQKTLADNPNDEEATKIIEEQTQAVDELTEEYQRLILEKASLGTVSELEVSQALQSMGVDLDNVSESLKEVKNKIQETFNGDNFTKFNQELEDAYGVIATIGENGNIEFQISTNISDEHRAALDEVKALQEDGTVDITAMYNGLTDEQKAQVDTLIELQDKQDLINFYMEMNGQDPVQTALDGIKEVLENIYKTLSETPTLSVDTATAESNVSRVLNKLKEIKNTDWSKTANVVTYETTYKTTVSRAQNVNGNANASGNAYAQGNWGAPKSEESLVGELGPELVVRGNRWFTVGNNGAEFTDIQKDDIIFNHVQTEQILKNGHINSRGKAYAQGTAYAGIHTWTNGYNSVGADYKNWSGSSDSVSDAASDISSAASDLSDASDEFKEVFDWFEVKLEEINEMLELMGAQLENIVDISGKNEKINSIIDENKYKVSVLAQGLKLYEDYANKLLADVPEQYRDAAQNGKIAIEEFAGDVGEKTLEAINNYRDWAKKVADVKQQMEELVQTIAELAKQKFDVIDDGFGDKISLINDQIDRLKDSISLTEKKGYISSVRYYKVMSNLTQERIDALKEEHELLQQSLDESVLSGDIQKYSEQWYDMVGALNDVDGEIIECESDLEEFQNAINDIYWDNFDQLINNLDYFKNETSNLIDLMEQCGDVVKDLSKEKDFWSADEVTWTDEGLTSLGLYAQQMEIAEYRTTQYKNAIKSLDKDYEDGKYSVSEYQEKLNDLKNSQYESIKSYYEAQDAIVNLNKTRVDSIKNGINKEIEAYEKLINKKKEELSVEKNAYDFQKNVASKQKSISDIERKIAALSGDYSGSAVAQRKKLESELLDAKKELEETYYDRSIEDQQNALDNELDNFKEQKDEEIKKWEKYLEDVEQVITDTLETVQANAIDIYGTLQNTASEYGLTLSDSIVNPWTAGAKAVSDYQEKFNTASSETCKYLDSIREKWQQVIDLMVLSGDADIASINSDNKAHTNAEIQKTVQTTSTQTQPAQAQAEPSRPSTAVGSTVVVKTSASYFATGEHMAPFVPGGSYTVYQDNGDRVLIGRDGVYTGWIYKSDIQGYAKGTTSVSKNQLAMIDELGEELVLHAGDNGKLQFLSKGSSVIPADITENLMTLGKINPQEMLDRNRASIGLNPAIVNNNVTIDVSYGDILHIDHFDGSNPDEIAKIVSQQFEAQTKKLNDSLRRFTR